jgi:hypothetical protein
VNGIALSDKYVWLVQNRKAYRFFDRMRARHGGDSRLELEIASAHANGLMSLDLLDPVTARDLFKKAASTAAAEVRELGQVATSDEDLGYVNALQSLLLMLDGFMDDEDPSTAKQRDEWGLGR